MRAEIELYKGHRCAYYGTLSVPVLLVEALRDKVGDEVLTPDASGSYQTAVLLRFHDAPEITHPAGPRPVAELEYSIGWFEVQFHVNGRKVHEGQYGVGALLGSALARMLQRLDPEERDWAFALRNLDLGETRPVPNVAGTVDVDLRRDLRPLPFTIQQVKRPPPATVDSAELGIDQADLGPVNVLVTEEIHDLMLRRLPLSRRIEEGGFILGRIQSTARDPERRLTLVTHVTPAERTGASGIHFTFTPDSFHEVNHLLGQRERGEEIIGWYHTHLFPSGMRMGTRTGLSVIDVETHQTTFRRHGQVAGLINLSRRERVLRFYSNLGDDMKECPLWIGDDRGRYRTARPDLGSG
jgi:hypothetical protein